MSWQEEKLLTSGFEAVSELLASMLNSCFISGRVVLLRNHIACHAQVASAVRACRVELESEMFSDSLNFSPHRKACRRFNEPGHAHALTFSCFRRQPLLTKDRSRQWLVEAIEKAREQHR
ncbi:hypothetical protein SH668x_001796 [Planctomicrobium sp. SH668]|uniref:hypothetical protein n=1 Tax=Planctomicrobium sp. SH668 TaxID=3448126 RepID=UPI003F5B3B5A